MATPARVKVFEATARKEPSETAEKVHTFVENTDVSVAEVDENGWRKVRMPDGSVAWIKSVELTMGEVASPLAAAPVPPPPALPTSSIAPTARAPIFIKDLDHLAELVSLDSQVHPMALNLASKQRTANVFFWGGMVVGGALMLLPLIAQDDCADTDYECSSDTGTLLLGAAVMTAGTVIGLAMRPGRTDLLDVLNTWNQRHPQEPFTIDANTVSGH